MFTLNEQGVGVSEAGVDKKVTKPPSPYTEGTLTADMINASKFIADKELRAQLSEADGIGTPATRAAIIDGLKDKKHIKVVGKTITSTELGQQLHDISPEDLKDPGKTAVWETELKLISQGKLNAEEFVARQKGYVSNLVDKLKGQKIAIGKQDGSPFAPLEERPCAAIGCLDGGTLQKIKGKFGPFWGCSKKKEGCCNPIKMDSSGNPYLYDPSDEPELPALAGAGEQCPVCKKGKKVVRVVKNPESKSFGKAFLACDSRTCKFVDWSQSDGPESPGSSSTGATSSRPEPLKGDGAPCRSCGNGLLRTFAVTNPKSPALGKRFLACSLKCGAKTIWEDQIDQNASQPIKLVPDMSNPWRLPGEGKPCPKCNAALVTQKVDPNNAKFGGKRFLSCSNAVCGNTIWEERAMKMF